MRQILGSCPLDCPDTCSWVVTVDDGGRAVKLRGNPAHPISRGGLCAKVNPWLEYAADPGRLLHPLRRIGAKGSGRFERIGWDEALTEIAERFHTIIGTHGAEAIWPFVGTGNLGWIQGSNHRGRIWNRMGAADHHLSICSLTGHAGLSYSVGTGAGMDPEDVVHAGLVLLWGTNTLVTNQHFWPLIERARDNGALVVVVDPTRTRTAARADVHLALRPGTDAALALGLCHEIVVRAGADEEFLSDRTLGWPEFRASLDEWDLDRTAEVTGIDVGTIAHLAQAIIDAPPLAVRVGQGMQRHARAGQAIRTVACLPAVVGSYGRIGGGLLYSFSGRPLLNREQGQRTDLGRRPRSLGMTNLAHHLLETDDPPVKALFCYGANPMVSNPDIERVRRGLERDDLFTVVVDLYRTATADYADLILPSTMQHEQLEINTSYFHLYVNLNEPAVDPPGECLPHTEIFRRLARAMGYDEPELFASDEDIAGDVLDLPHFAAAGVTLESLRSTGFARVPGSTPYAPFAETFPTPSGRFEFVSSAAESDGYDRLPSYQPPAEAVLGDDDTGLALVAAASEHHISSTFAGTARVRSRNRAPSLILHPKDAADRGIAAGDRLFVRNDRGRFEAVADISDDVREGVAVSTKGWWGQGLNATVAERDSDMVRGPVFHDNRVIVERAHDQERMKPR